MNVRRVAVCMALFLLVGGCKKRRPPPEPSTRATAAKVHPKKPAPSRKWERHYEVRLAEGLGEASFFVGNASSSSDDPWQIRAHFKLPHDTKVTFEGQAGSIDKYGSWSTTVSILDKIASAKAVDAVSKEFDLQLKFTAEVPGYEAFEEVLPNQPLRSALAHGFGKIVDRPVTFPNEPEKPGPVDGLIVVSASSDVSLIGNPKTIADIDLIAIVDIDKTPSREKTCTGYGKPVTLQMFDRVASIYDRRTAKMLVEKRFSPSHDCPSMAFVTNGKTSSYASMSDVEKWARAELQKRKR